MGYEVIGCRLIDEAPALKVDLQEGLTPKIELHDGARQGLAVITRGHTWRYGTTVEDHGGSLDVLLRAYPQRRPESVTVIGGVVAYCRATAGYDGDERLNHLLVCRIAARGKDGVLRVYLDIASVGGREYGAGDRAAALTQEFLKTVLIRDGVTGVGDDLLRVAETPSIAGLLANRDVLVSR
jgi:hypothetical protein